MRPPHATLWHEVIARVGAGWARVWRLYLAGGALAVDENRMGVDQIVAAGQPWIFRRRAAGVTFFALL